MKRVILALALVLGTVMPSMAQVQGGSISGVVTDVQQGVLPGVTVTLTGSDRTAVFVTEATGQYRFLNLPPGSYQLKFDLTGFATFLREGIELVVGQSVQLPITMKVASVAETVTVSGQAPIVDTKATGTATNFTMAELSSIPTSRDPWALLRTVPGVLIDRVNIAGNETGQQSNFQSKGTRPNDAVWTMDGVVITDMSAIGASPTYFNYDNFEEIQVSTSGQNITQPTGGMGLNFVVKRGTNQLRGAMRGYLTGENLEWTNLPDELRARNVTPATADHNKQISDYGAELGGPIVTDRAWAYGSWSRQDVRLVRRSGNLIDRTVLKQINAKGNWQATKKDMVSVLWFYGAKEKYGRSPGIRNIIFDAQTATYDQGGVYVDGRPKGLLKIEDNRIIASNFYLTGKFASYNTGFGLLPEGGLDMQAGESALLGRSFGSTQQLEFLRPQTMASADANYFLTSGGATHEIKFGGGWRRADATTRTLWPGNMVLARQNSATDLRARVYREGSGTDRVETFHLYAGDTISKGRVTIDAGIRFDRQGGRALPSSTQSNKAFPDLVPGIQFAGYEAPFVWNNVSPRAGVTCAVDAGNKTLLRASFARYSGQIENGIVGQSNPSSSVGYAEYRWVDRNGDHFAQADEVLVAQGPISVGGGFDPANPTSVVSSSLIDPNLKAAVTTSVVAGLDRELVPNLALQVNYSYTRTSNYSGNYSWNYYATWVGVSRADYLPGDPVTGTLPDGTAYNIPTYYPDATKIEANNSQSLLTNWPGYYTYYHGVEAALVKRLSNRWMGRVSVAYNQAREWYGSSPTDMAANPTRTDLSPLVNGGQFATQSVGSGLADTFMSAKWQVNANGSYQFPRDIEVGGSLFGRQGYPFAIYRNADLGYDGSMNVLVAPLIDTYRLPNLWNLDLRVAKSIKLSRARLQLIGDLFNVTNANTAMLRNRNLDSPNFNQLAQNLSPRILRLGLRVTF